MIDGGTGRTYPRVLKRELQAIGENGQSIDLLIVSHIDDDHIAGIIKLFEDGELDKSIIKEVWFNSGELLNDYFGKVNDGDRRVTINPDPSTEISVRQGISLERFLRQLGCWREELIKVDNQPYELHGAKITVLSPDLTGLQRLHQLWTVEEDRDTQIAVVESDHKQQLSELLQNEFSEDDSPQNGSSIAFLFEFEGKRLLFLADSHPSAIVEALSELAFSEMNKLRLAAVKISHHGSKKNLSPQLMRLIQSDGFIISTDGSKHGHPDKECLARVIAGNGERTKLYFNYDNDVISNIFSNEDRQATECVKHS